MSWELLSKGLAIALLNASCGQKASDWERFNARLAHVANKPLSICGIEVPPQHIGCGWYLRMLGLTFQVFPTAHGRMHVYGRVERTDIDGSFGHRKLAEAEGDTAEEVVAALEEQLKASMNSERMRHGVQNWASLLALVKS